MLSTNLKKAVLSHTAFITIHLKEAEEGVYALLLFLKIQQNVESEEAELLRSMWCHEGYVM